MLPFLFHRARIQIQERQPWALMYGCLEFSPALCEVSLSEPNLRDISLRFSAVYNVQATLDGAFLLQSQAVLRSLADISWDVHNTVGLSSRLSSHMILSYHHVSSEISRISDGISRLIRQRAVYRISNKAGSDVYSGSVHAESRHIIETSGANTLCNGD